MLTINITFLYNIVLNPNHNPMDWVLEFPLPESKMPSVCDEPIFYISVGKIQPMKL